MLSAIAIQFGFSDKPDLYMFILCNLKYFFIATDMPPKAWKIQVSCDFMWNWMYEPVKKKSGIRVFVPNKMVHKNLKSVKLHYLDDIYVT